ncbi:MAG TPA: mechanosensitive ion channel family protein [Steroidobacteraceae bacterium]|nr:mechanosensitive ion channel family protein [Steroidobacteraceae bacterium]
MHRPGKWLLLGLCALAQYGACQPAAPTRVSVLSGAQVIQILDDTVDWYRALGTQQENATQPSDLLILFANRQTADKVVSLAFDIARANAELLSSEADSDTDALSQSQSHSQQQAQLDSEQQAITQEMATDRTKAAAAGKAGADLQAKLLELQGELAMVNARRNLLDTMTEFVRSSDPKAANANALKAQIDAIAATVPSAALTIAPGATPAATPATAATAAASTTAAPAAPARSGIWDLGVEVFRQRSKIGAIESIDARTAALADTFRRISAAPLAQLQGYSARSNSLAAQADHASGAALKGLRDQFDTLAWLFKQTSDMLLPLGKEQVLLKQYRRNLASWHSSAEKQYHQALTSLGIRIGIVLGILAIVFVLGEVWRRAVIGYVHDLHRRYQLLLVRTIVVWTIALAVICLSFVTQVSTFATFAGLLTAGLAVAMQSVLVSVVGYFFLIGKYGLRVGDRIQIGAVVGEVLDIGLVRLHLRELNQQGPLGATGRVVAFANSVAFQAAGGLFKQLPDSDVSWHETTVPLPAVSDYAALKAKLLHDITTAIGEHRPERAPQVQMRLAAGHMEVLIRYAVGFTEAAQIDERVALAVLGAIAQYVPAAGG